MFQISDMDEDGLGGVDAVLYQWDWDHVLEGIVDEVLNTKNAEFKDFGGFAM